MPRKYTPLPVARTLLKKAFRRWRASLKLLTLIVGVWFAVDLALMYLLGNTSMTPGVWFVVVFAVLVWFYGRSPRSRTPKLRDAYFRGSAEFLKHFIVFLVWLIYLIPFAVGAFFAQQFTLYQFSPSNAELIGVNFAWLLLGSVSFFWFVRSFVAPIYVSRMGPIAAIRAAWAFSKGRAWWMSKSVLLGVFASIVPLILLALLMFLPVANTDVLSLAVNLSVSFVAVWYTVPLLIILGYELKSYEESRSTRTKS